MKNFFIKIKNNILLSTIYIVLIFALLCFINYLFGVMYRQWVYYIILLISVVGTILGIIQIRKNTNKKHIKILFTIVLIIFLILPIIFWQFFLLIFAFSYKPEHIVSKDNKLYVAYVDSFLNVDVYYYDYINFFLVGNKVKIHEFYGNGGYDPFDSKHNDISPLKTTYYDDNKKEIKNM